MRRSKSMYSRPPKLLKDKRRGVRRRIINRARR